MEWAHIFVQISFGSVEPWFSFGTNTIFEICYMEPENVTKDYFTRKVFKCKTLWCHEYKIEDTIQIWTSEKYPSERRRFLKTEDIFLPKDILLPGSEALTVTILMGRILSRTIYGHSNAILNFRIIFSQKWHRFLR